VREREVVFISKLENEESMERRVLGLKLESEKGIG
jgi:hypothetical protein